jgi:DNA-binding beta-propeller fold protein YncE
MRLTYRVAVIVTGIITALISAGPAVAASVHVGRAGQSHPRLAMRPGPGVAEAGDPADSTSIAVSPDGSTVFAAGQPLAAYKAATGATLWTAGNGTFPDSCCDLVVSPDGSTLFATGAAAEANGTVEYATAAYDVATGAQLWLATYHGPGVGGDRPDSIAVSPDGSTVFVTGSSSNTTTPNILDSAYATVAYGAATGAQLWVRRYSDGNHNANAGAVTVSPDGTRVYVTGASLGLAVYQFATLAYNAATGATVWTERYSHGKGGASGMSVAVSPDGSRLYVGGAAHGRGGQNITVVAYTASDGTMLWATPYRGLGGPSPTSMAMSPDGSELVVTGQGRSSSSQGVYLTVAFRAASGALLWARPYGALCCGVAESVAISPDGSELVVTGFLPDPSFTTDTDYETVAYKAATGAWLWAKRYAPVKGQNYGTGVVVSPDGSKVFVTGGRAPSGNGTVAYNSATGARLWVASH